MYSKWSRREFLRESALLTAGSLLALNIGSNARAASSGRRVIVWSEGSAPKSIYPDDINTAIAEGLRSLKGWDVKTASLNDPDQGLPQETLQSANVLIWWGHQHHGDVRDELVARIVHRVKEEGMGFIGTHSAHWSKPFIALMGTSCSWNGGYVEDGSKLDVIVRDPKHPIARGIGDFVVPHTERYTEPFDAPTPADLIFDGVYTRPDGLQEKSRQGMTWQIGKGRVFYFQPGHESYPIYFQPEIRHVFRNAVGWCGAKHS